MTIKLKPIESHFYHTPTTGNSSNPYSLDILNLTKPEADVIGRFVLGMQRARFGDKDGSGSYINIISVDTTRTMSGAVIDPAEMLGSATGVTGTPGITPYGQMRREQKEREAFESGVMRKLRDDAGAYSATEPGNVVYIAAETKTVVVKSQDEIDREAAAAAMNGRFAGLDIGD